VLVLSRRWPVPAPDVALAFDARQRGLAAATANAAGRLWSTIPAGADFDAAYGTVFDRVLQLVAAGQLAAATDAGTYLRDVLPAVDLPDAPVAAVDPAAFVGVASDGRPLGSLLFEPVVRAKEAGGGVAGLAAGGEQLRMIVLTQLADAAREAVGVGIAARPAVGGYVRMLTPPSCGRCAILAGKWFRWNAGFARHPRCDCRHIPAAENRAGDFRTDPRAAIESGNVHGLSKASLKAISDGADPGQIVNAYRGMATAQVAGQQVAVTTEGTTRRGYASYVRRAIDEQRGTQTPETARQVGRRGRVANSVERRIRPRLMPSEIYRQATDRADAVRLLTANGYLLPARGQSLRQLAASVA
jgi:hypothetical protein